MARTARMKRIKFRILASIGAVAIIGGIQHWWPIDDTLPQLVVGVILVLTSSLVSSVCDWIEDRDLHE